MPNWCENRLSVTGPADDVTRFVEAAKGMPQSFKLVHEWDIKRNETHPPQPEAFSFHALVPLPADVATREYDSPETRDHGESGYEWEKRMWGIKWGASRSALVRHDPCIAVYTYTTPWGPGHVFFWRLSCLWPTLRFAVSYDEEFPSRGRFVASEGKVIRFDDTDSPDFTEEQQNADEEGCHDAWKKWRGELVATHDAWVADGSSMPEVSP